MFHNLKPLFLFIFSTIFNHRFSHRDHHVAQINTDFRRKNETTKSRRVTPKGGFAHWRTRRKNMK